MMYIYTGTPGSGKSFHTAKLILDTLRFKRLPVIANFDINPNTKGIQRFTYIPNSLLEPAKLYEFAKTYWKDKKIKEDSILLVIDEAQLVFNSRSWNHKSRMDWIEFLSQHRHYGYKIILITQHDRMIDRQIRSLVEIEVNHRRLDNYGWKGKLLSLPFKGKLIAAISYFYGLNQKVSSEWLIPRKRIFKLYDSYNKFEQI